MGKILKAFLTDQLRVNDGAESQDSEHQLLCEKVCELQEKLAKKLNEEEKKTLMELVNTSFEESCCYAESKFQRGYLLGVLMATEVFSEQDTFL